MEARVSDWLCVWFRELDRGKARFIREVPETTVSYNRYCSIRLTGALRSR
jgi:hypothetical protein